MNGRATKRPGRHALVSAEARRAGRNHPQTISTSTPAPAGLASSCSSIVNGSARAGWWRSSSSCRAPHRGCRRRTEIGAGAKRATAAQFCWLQKALDNLDEVIRLIRAAGRRGSSGIADCALRVHRKAGASHYRSCNCSAHREERRRSDELAEIERAHRGVPGHPGSDKVLRDLIVDELKEIARTTAMSAAPRSSKTRRDPARDLVAVEDVAITVTRGGY